MVSSGAPARPTARQRIKRALDPVPGAVPAARTLVEAARMWWHYRVTGLAAEAAFWTLFSLPPMILGLISTVGFVGDRLGPDTVQQVTDTILDWSGRFFTDNVMEQVIQPTVADTLDGGRADLLSIGFLISLWSGSRALNVFLDTIMIMYGQSGERSIFRMRVMSLGLYLGTLLVGAVVFPLVLVGPRTLGSLLPDAVDFVMALYWPTVGVLGLGVVTLLFHIATPIRSPYWRDVPGAVLAVLVWVLASAGVRLWAEGAVGGPSVYGPLAAPIVVMVWLFFISLAILLGAGLNGAIRRLWPPEEYRGPRIRAAEWWDLRRSTHDERRQQEHDAADAGEEFQPMRR